MDYFTQQQYDVSLKRLFIPDAFPDPALPNSCKLQNEPQRPEYRVLGWFKDREIVSNIAFYRYWPCHPTTFF
jgi:hypothetical protein